MSLRIRDWLGICKHNVLTNRTKPNDFFPSTFDREMCLTQVRELPTPQLSTSLDGFRQNGGLDLYFTLTKSTREQQGN